jgi:alkaline phosphatase D
MPHAHSRREFLRTVVVAAGGLAATRVAGCTDSVTTPSFLDGRQFFPQSVASGDPRPDSVILWARVQDDAAPAGSDLSLRLLVATDAAFRNLVVDQGGLLAKAANDRCLKVKVTRLQRGTVYYYRFVYQSGGRSYGSAIAKTKTAPAPDADVFVRFAVVNCQDYAGRYFNSYIRVADETNLDFVLHLGDYIYETTGDPTFQTPTPDRAITFADSAGAITLGTAPNTYQAAASLDNYRQLYRTYRSDPILQKVHERNAFVTIWDDHEYTNDCWGATGTYYNGRQNETNVERRKNAERAFFDYIPIDPVEAPAGTLETTEAELYPASRIYRELKFGKLVHLVLTDFRTYRPDHIIPEDAFPGAVVLDRATLTAAGAYDAFASTALFGYVTFADLPTGYQQVLTGVLTAGYVRAGLAAQAAGAKAAAVLTGKINVAVLNGLIAQYNATNPPQPLPALGTDGLDRGVAYVHFGKQGLFSATGSRNFVVRDTLDLYAAVRWAATNHASENVLGSDQEAWLRSTLTTSTATWKLVASSVQFATAGIDLRGVASVPAAFRQRFYITADDWDGFPNKRDELLAFFAGIPGTVVLSGDNHVAFVTEHTAGANTLAEFAGPAISSNPLQIEAQQLVASDPNLSAIPGVETLVASLPDLIRGAAGGAQRLGSINTNGFMLVEARANALFVDVFLLPGNLAATKLYDRPDDVRARFLQIRFTVKDGKLS